MKLTSTLKSAAVGALALSTAMAYTVDAHAGAITPAEDWNFNLSVLNGLTIDDNGTATTADDIIVSGLSDITGIDHLSMGGQSTVTQTLSGFSADGQSFTVSGVLAFTGYRTSGAAFDTPLSLGGYTLYLTYEDLTGTFEVDPGTGEGSFTYTSGAGDISLWLENDADATIGNSARIEIVDFAMDQPSGGTGFSDNGGAGPDSLLAITLDALSMTDTSLFTDKWDQDFELDDYVFEAINSNALQEDEDASGVDATTGDGEIIQIVNHTAQFNIGNVPEPATLALFGMGLIGIGAVGRRRKS